VVILLGAISDIFLAQYDHSLAFALAFVVAHFFLFCNLIRMPRSLEMLWAAAFLALAAMVLITQWLNWTECFVFSSVSACALIGFHLFSPSYHGIFWQTVNPNLPQWWQEKCQRVR
jgi:hypothetical protein